jgi:hypothetical protein
MPCRRLPALLLVLIFLTACRAARPPATPGHLNLAPVLRASSTDVSPEISSTDSPIPTIFPQPSATLALPSRTPFGPRAPVRRGETAGVPPLLAARTASGGEGPALSLSPERSQGATASATPLPVSLGLDPADWHDWPVVSPVPENARQIYLHGQELGDDPHAFSVFGDCQSEPDVFMGVYETDPDLYNALPAGLQETVDWFRGSFNRLSPTVRPGTTTGALLWTLWHQNKFTCTRFETPLQCELRIHKPSFVIIQIGSHYETRNKDYMSTILEQLIEAGVVPILSTKADNREHDEHVNAEYAQLAVEYNIPFWNFWAAVDDLPNRGLYTSDLAPFQGDLYLTDEAVAIHRLTALQALDAVRRAVVGGQ